MQLNISSALARKICLRVMNYTSGTYLVSKKYKRLYYRYLHIFK